MSDDHRPARKEAGAVTRNWWIYRGTGQPLTDIRLADILPPPPGWRDFDGGPVLPPVPAESDENDRRLGVAGRATPRQKAQDIDLINTALLLRRPLLVTGRPGIGKSTLAYLVSRELGLGRVLRWGITSRTSLRSGLYEYDAIGRAQASVGRGPAAGPVPDPLAGSAKDDEGRPRIGDFVRLGPLGTALLPYELPRVLLIDELDKGDIDLPNDLLHVLENGSFDIPELVRARQHEGHAQVFTDDPVGTVEVVDGRVTCRAFPFIVITSNGERQFPPAFLRRCIRLDVSPPTQEQLAAMIAAHFRDPDGQYDAMIAAFMRRSAENGGLATDQLLNAVFLRTKANVQEDDDSWTGVLNTLWRDLSGAP
ncbi:AAA family ATPase [Actinacidiphila sp. ITFR-21]|uniref:AAA family ATPase n=1 Tax=Actinacidiphila sp. ITFR-21 TaxID=3075199 RepID=UPI00288C4A54|nr:MoxR family ATPase [Streptomyces sp. ITFR-21]WNI16427.1 MoxR family ATPase [Streptomyces sp. ITFR-21]